MSPQAKKQQQKDEKDQQKEEQGKQEKQEKQERSSGGLSEVDAEREEHNRRSRTRFDQPSGTELAPEGQRLPEKNDNGEEDQ